MKPLRTTSGVTSVPSLAGPANMFKVSIYLPAKAVVNASLS